MKPEMIKVACSNCNLRELCMPMGLSDHDLERLDDLVAIRRKIKRGATLFSTGDKFTSLYAIRTGFFKTCLASEDGRDQGRHQGGDGAVSAFIRKSSETAVRWIAVSFFGVSLPPYSADRPGRPRRGRPTRPLPSGGGPPAVHCPNASRFRWSSRRCAPAARGHPTAADTRRRLI